MPLLGHNVVCSVHVHCNSSRITRCHFRPCCKFVILADLRVFQSIDRCVQDWCVKQPADLPTHFGLSVCLFVCIWRDSPQWARAPSLTRFLDHTTTHHSRYDSSGHMISSSQRLLPDNTQHSQQTDIHAHGGIRTRNLTRRAVVDLRLYTARPLGPASYSGNDSNEWKP